MKCTALFLIAAAACASAPPQPEPHEVHDIREWDVDSGGVAIHVRSVGGTESSAALIAIHGGPGLSHHYLEPLEKLASPRLRIVNYDQRGVGKSGKPALKDGKIDPDQFGVDRYVADLDAVIASLHAPRIHLAAHSWGGMIAQGFLAAHSDGAASVAFISAIPPTHDAFVDGVKHMAERRKALVAQGIIPEKAPPNEGESCAASIQAILPAYFHDPKLQPTSEIRATSCHSGINKATFSKIDQFDYRSALGAFKGRALVFEGQSDPFGLTWAEDTAAALGAAKLEKVLPPACGHFPWLECSEAFFGAMKKLVGDDA